MSAIATQPARELVGAWAAATDTTHILGYDGDGWWVSIDADPTIYRPRLVIRSRVALSIEAAYEDVARTLGAAGVTDFADFAR